MKKRTINTNDELIRRAVSILLDKLGPADTNRFLTIVPQERFDSVRRHQKWQASLDKKAFFKEISTAENDTGEHHVIENRDSV